MLEQFSPVLTNTSWWVADGRPSHRMTHNPKRAGPRGPAQGLMNGSRAQPSPPQNNVLCRNFCTVQGGKEKDRRPGQPAEKENVLLPHPTQIKAKIFPVFKSDLSEVSHQNTPQTDFYASV